MKKKRSFHRLIGRGLEALERRELLSAAGLCSSNLLPLAVQTGQTAPWSSVFFPPAPPSLGLVSTANTMATANDLGTLSGAKTVTGAVTRADREDYYSFTVTTKGDFTLAMTGLQGDADVVLLKDRNGNRRADPGEVLGISQNWGTADEHIAVSLDPGTYYVVVYRYSGDTNYTLTLNAGSAKSPPTVTTPASAALGAAGKTATLTVGATDDPGQALMYTWSATTLPSGAASPTFSDNGDSTASVTTATFSSAGTYVFRATIVDTAGAKTTSTVSLTVTALLTGLVVTPANPTVVLNATQQFTASGLDQFGHSMAAPADCAWSDTLGSIGPTSGLYTASATGSGAVTVSSASTKLNASTGVTVVKSNYLGLKDAGLATLTQSLDVDGSISRNDMIQILTSAGSDDGVVDAKELSDLKTILKNATTLKIAGYVQVLAGDVVNGNRANAHYQGATLGNLAAGSSATQLDKLIDKWFKGTDHPDSGGYTYRLTTGSLFAGTPTHVDEHQGNLGDCYFISSIGTIADSSSAAVQNMFIDNKDGTWTVRFYANGVADYVTVDAMLPTSGGSLVYAGAGVNGSLWISLAEKAYAQWNETGKEGRDGTNTYAGIEGGWMADVDAQVLGHSAASYNVSSTADQNALIAALNKKLAVTIGTVQSYRADGTLSYGLYGSHAYAVIGYNSTRGTFQLYNPWGDHQPGELTWQQLRATCDGFVVANATGTVPISATAARSSGSHNVIAQRSGPSLATMADGDAAGLAGPGRSTGLSAREVDAVLGSGGVFSGFDWRGVA
jgi:hypothetical protein